ncbi:uncharacterized protein LOC134192692 [Corticium candelabrum]|uniref:uncharacterized protein LOC134192692 n=1 Tax=Corticium candelabrum TaxID=121492 RepID=UPI002E25932E|nr:uncharacterized protein LOC134192692 [Corticium candelabrum]
MAMLLVLLASLIAGSSSYFVPPSSVDFEFPQPAFSNGTCGTPSESYFDPADGINKTCDATNSLLAHPPENIVDNDGATWWQSKKGVDMAQLELNLTEFRTLLVLLGKVSFVNE